MKNNKIAYAEVDEILSLMDEKYVNIIPKQLRAIFKEEKSSDYKPKISTEKLLNEQNLQRETLVILAILCLNYWCESEEEKKELIKVYSENEKKKETEIREKYNPDNIFKKPKEKNDSVQVVEYHENILKKIWIKIKLLLKKDNK